MSSAAASCACVCLCVRCSRRVSVQVRRATLRQLPEISHPWETVRRIPPRESMRVKLAVGGAYSFCPVRHSDTSQSWASVRSCMRKRVDSIFHTGLNVTQTCDADRKSCGGWLHGSQRKYMPVLFPFGWKLTSSNCLHTNHQYVLESWYLSWMDVDKSQNFSAAYVYIKKYLQIAKYGK